MRTLLIVLAVLSLAPEALAQKPCTALWFQVTSRSGSVLIPAREVSTRTDRSGRTTITADGAAIQTKGTVWVIALGSKITVDGYDLDASETPTSPGSGGAGGRVPIPYPDISVGGGDLPVEISDEPVDVPVVGGGTVTGPGSGGIVSGSSPKPDTGFVLFSFDVKIEGKNVTRFSDLTTTAETSGGATTTTTTSQPGGGGTCESNPPIGN